MKPGMPDLEVLLRIQPLTIASYLRSHGWQKYSEVKERYSIWIQQGDNGIRSEDVLLPLNPDYDDYSLRVSELIDTLQSVEGRTRSEILQDIQTPNHDLIRIALSLGERVFLSLEEEFVLLRAVRGLFLSAACSAIDPQPAHRHDVAKSIHEYLHKLEILQCSSGRLEVRSPVLPIVEHDYSDASEETESFERKSVKTLFQALVTLCNAVKLAMEENTEVSIRALVAAGVSENLCSSLRALQSATNASLVRFDFVWSPARTVEDSALYHRVLVSRDMIAIVQSLELALQAAARYGPQSKDDPATLRIEVLEKEQRELIEKLKLRQKQGASDEEKEAIMELIAQKTELVRKHAN
jgi:hypothetical protein